MFNQTIKENLLNAQPDATDQQIEESLKLAMAYDFVQKLPNGINSDAGAVGAKLSGGQKQRIAIARAMLRNPDVLILDEATSALDQSNERKVQQAIDNIRRKTNMTILVIAHRLSTVKDADKIYVLDKGKVIESGKHEFLMNNRSTYCSFFRAQENASQERLEAMGYSNQATFSYSNSDSTCLSEKELQAKYLAGDKSPANQYYENMNAFIILWNLLKYNTPKILIFFSILGAGYVACSYILISVPQVKITFGVILSVSKAQQKEHIIKYCSILGAMGIAAF